MSEALSTELIELGVERRITASKTTLDSWRQRTDLYAKVSKLDPPKFTKEEALERFALGCPVKPKSTPHKDPWDYYAWYKRGHKLPDAVSKEEAHFLIVAFALEERLDDHRGEVSSVASLEEMTFDGELAEADAVLLIEDMFAKLGSRFSWVRFVSYEFLVKALSALYGKDKALKLAWEKFGVQGSGHDQVGVVSRLPPARDEAEFARFSAYADELIETLDLSGQEFDYRTALMLSARGHLESRFEPLIELFSQHSKEMLSLPADFERVLAQLDPETQIHYVHKYRRSMSYASGLNLFARIGWEAAPELIDWAEGTIEGYTLIQNFIAPEFVKAGVILTLKGKERLATETWLKGLGATAIAGLIQLAPTTRGNIREQVYAFLRYFKVESRETLDALLELSTEAEVAAVTKHVIEWEPKSRPELDAATRPEWLTELHEKAREFVNYPLTVLPKLFTADDAHQLTDTDCLAVLNALTCSSNKSGPAHLEEIKAFVSETDLNKLSWVIYDRWVASRRGYFSVGWELYQVGYVGGDTEAIKVGKDLKTWPGDLWRDLQKALEIFRIMGSNISLMVLHNYSMKGRPPSVKKRAGTLIDEVAKKRGLSDEELADRIIPDCGLGEKGRRVFDYGARQFTFMFNEEFKAVFRDEKRQKIVKSLPKPNKTDDQDKGIAAKEEYKEMAKQIREVVKIQRARLEHGMVVGRRWSGDAFHELFVDHPLMCHFVRRLLWGVYDEENKLKHCFRVDEENVTVDADDEALELSADVNIGIVHPLDLDEKMKTTWGTVFGDYEIIPPFEQLARPIFTPTDEEATTSTITRFEELEISPGSLRGMITSDGWEKGGAEDGGIISNAAKYFSASGITAVMNFTGIYAGGGQWDDMQKIFGVSFAKGASSWHSEGITLADVPTTVFSETLYSITKLTSRSS